MKTIFLGLSFGAASFLELAFVLGKLVWLQCQLEK